MAINHWALLSFAGNVYIPFQLLQLLASVDKKKGDPVIKLTSTVTESNLTGDLTINS